MITHTAKNGKKKPVTFSPSEEQLIRIDNEREWLRQVICGGYDPRGYGLHHSMMIGYGTADVYLALCGLWNSGVQPADARYKRSIRLAAKTAKMPADHIEHLLEPGPTAHADYLADKIREAATAEDRARIAAEIHTRSQRGDDTSELVEQLRELEQPKQTAEAKRWLIPADEFSAGCEPVRYLVKRWLPEKSLVMVHGASGSGKTFAVLDWALRIASGVDQWQGMKVKPGAVVILAGEGHAGLKGRIRGWKQSHRIESTRLSVSPHGVDLDSAGGVALALEAIDALPDPPAMVVVDTLHAHMTGDENQAKDAGAMLAGCRAILQRYGCTVLLVHHTGVAEGAQGRARGSSAWRAALDVEISVQVVNGVRVLEQTKNKDAQAAEPRAFEIEPVAIDGWKDEDGDQVFTAIASPAEVPSKQQPESKADSHRKLFAAAWNGTGAELVDGRPYVSRSGMLEFLTQSRGLSNGSAQAYVKPGRAGKPICDLLTARAIDVEEHGWIVVDREWADSLILHNPKQGQRNNGTERNFAEQFRNGQSVGQRNGTEHTL